MPYERNRTLFITGLAALVYCLGMPTFAQAQTVHSSPYRPKARTFRYLRKQDDFLRYRSAVAAEPVGRPGGDLSYYGNRLRQFRYSGEIGDGGYYDAWNDYVRDHKLDPGKYQYRFGVP